MKSFVKFFVISAIANSFIFYFMHRSIRSDWAKISRWVAGPTHYHEIQDPIFYRGLDDYHCVAKLDKATKELYKYYEPISNFTYSPNIFYDVSEDGTEVVSWYSNRLGTWNFHIHLKRNKLKL